LSDRVGEQTLEALVHQTVEMTLQQYRLQPGFMRALTRFVESDADDEFRTRALHFLSIVFERLAGRLLAHRDLIPHPDPHKAIIFALSTMAPVIEDRALEQVSMWKELTRFSDEEFTEEVDRDMEHNDYSIYISGSCLFRCFSAQLRAEEEQCSEE
jgi:hypothetical protein